jgi:hypothetical protein
VGETKPRNGEGSESKGLRDGNGAFGTTGRTNAAVSTKRISSLPKVDATSSSAAPGIFIYLTPLWVAIVCSIVLFARKSDSFLNPQFWAEDGIVFFMGARDDGIHSFLKPFDGSLYFFQRIVAYVGNWVPVRYAPHFYNGVAFATTVAVAVYISLSRIDLKNRWLFALAVVIIPHYGEVFMTLTNVHWILALGLIVFIVSRDPETHWQRIVEPVMVLITCLSGAFVLLFMPLFLLRAAVRRTWFSVLVAIIAAGCFWIVWTKTNTDRFAEAVNFRDPNWLGYWGNSLAGMLLLGQPITKTFPNSIYWVGLSVLLYGGLILYALIKRDRMCGVFLWAAAAMLGAVAYSYRGEPLHITHTLAFRYSYIPYVCTAWVLIVMLEKSPRLQRVAAFALFLITVSSASVFASGPMVDLNWKEASRGIDGPVPCVVPVNPVETYHIHYIPK